MNTNLYSNITIFLKKRVIELTGILLMLLAILLLISFLSYSPDDPSLLVYGTENLKTNNYLGIYGSLASDFLLQSFGISSFLILITIFSWGISLISNKKINDTIKKLFYIFLYLIFSCVLINKTFNSSFWLIDNGNSGFVGQILFTLFSKNIPYMESIYTSFTLLTLSLIFFFLASNISFKFLLNFTFSPINSIFKKEKKN